MGVVYRGRDTRDGREVAVKVLDSELAKDPTTLGRFLAEARTLMRIDHPNVVQVLDVGSADNHYMVMELVAGEPLSRVLAGGALPLDRAILIAADLAGALAAVHQAGVVHRDIKPDNLMVTADGALKLIDFGVAREAAELNVMHTQNGALLGTPAYMAPEQECGKPADYRADIYAFGAVVYEMITGARAFSADNFAALAVQHLTLRVPPPSELADGVPEVLDALVAQCLAKEPQKRVANMDEVETLLRQTAIFLEHSPVRPRRPAKRARRSWAMAAVACAALMLAVGGWRMTQRQLEVAAPAVHIDDKPPVGAAKLPPAAALAAPALAAPAPASAVTAGHGHAAKMSKHPARKRAQKDYDKAGLIDAFAP